jgi:hypothetical protein
VRLETDTPLARVAGASSVSVPVSVQVDPTAVTPGSHRIDFEVRAIDDDRLAATAYSTFYMRAP